jgi:hypothetical protein
MPNPSGNGPEVRPTFNHTRVSERVSMKRLYGGGDSLVPGLFDPKRIGTGDGTSPPLS